MTSLSCAFFRFSSCSIRISFCRFSSICLLNCFFINSTSSSSWHPIYCFHQFLYRHNLPYAYVEFPKIPKLGLLFGFWAVFCFRCGSAPEVVFDNSIFFLSAPFFPTFTLLGSLNSCGILWIIVEYANPASLQSFITRSLMSLLEICGFSFLSALHIFGMYS